jgi:glycine/D-amino acid oxidase-like deaminating enzyme
MVRTSRLIVGALGATLIGSIGASAVAAAAPTRVVEEVHISGTFPAGTRCPFEVVRTIDGTLATTTFIDAAGLTTQKLLWENGKIGYLNPANGKTLATPLAGPAVIADNGDGTSTVFVPGNDQRYTAPGLGFIVGNTGLSIVTIDNATGEVVSIDKLAGHQDGTPFPALCAGLA